MEVSGFSFRLSACFSSATTSSSSRPSFCDVRIGGVSLRTGEAYRVMDSLEFRDKGHLQCYYSQGSTARVRCGGNKKEKQSTKKTIKLLKSLSQDLPIFSDNGFVTQAQANLVSEAAQGLMKQLQELRAEEKELKRERKKEKAKLKSRRTNESSSSSASSESECGEVINMDGLRNAALPLTRPVRTEAISTKEDASSPNACRGCNSSAARIEVCMGNKCNKSGGAALLQEFQRVIGVEGAVVGCKCMGKCRDGPNVRLVNSVNDTNIADNPLCLGVGLEDVGVIVANFLGQDDNHLGFASASASTSYN